MREKNRFQLYDLMKKQKKKNVIPTIIPFSLLDGIFLCQRASNYYIRWGFSQTVAASLSSKREVGRSSQRTCSDTSVAYHRIVAFAPPSRNTHFAHLQTTQWQKLNEFWWKCFWYNSHMSSSLKLDMRQKAVQSASRRKWVISASKI